MWREARGSNGCSPRPRLHLSPPLPGDLGGAVNNNNTELSWGLSWGPTSYHHSTGAVGICFPFLLPSSVSLLVFPPFHSSIFLVLPILGSCSPWLFLTSPTILPGPQLALLRSLDLPRADSLSTSSAPSRCLAATVPKLPRVARSSQGRQGSPGPLRVIYYPTCLCLSNLFCPVPVTTQASVQPPLL